MGVIRHGVWDCKHCGAIGIPKSALLCPNCKATRPINVKFYLPENAPIVTDANEIAQALVGPNWICSACSGDNTNDHDICVHCDAPRGSSKSRETHVYQGDAPHSAEEARIRLGEKDETVGSSSFHPVDQESSTGSVGFVSPSDSSSSNGLYTSPVQDFSSSVGETSPYGSSFERKSASNFGKWFIIAAVALIIGGLFFFLTRTHELTAKVTSFSWSRNIYIQVVNTVREEDWSVPIGGRQISVTQKQSGTKQVFDHNQRVPKQVIVSDGTEYYKCDTENKDLGNGDFEEVDVMCTRQLSHEETVYETVPVYRDEPVYADWYTYDIEKWVNARIVSTSGSSQTDPGPFWGKFTLAQGGYRNVGAERVDHEDEDYIVTLTSSEGKQYTRFVSYNEWMLYDSNSTYTLVLNNLDMIVNDPVHPSS